MRTVVVIAINLGLALMPLLGNAIAQERDGMMSGRMHMMGSVARARSAAYLILTSDCGTSISSPIWLETLQAVLHDELVRARPRVSAVASE